MANTKTIFTLVFIALFNSSCTQKEESVVLVCSGKESYFDFLTMSIREKSFNSVVIKVRKKGNDILAITIDEFELTKEKRAVDSKSPNFLRWFEQTSEGIITYGKNSTDRQEPKWNFKLSSAGIFEREGIGINQKGTCTTKQKAF
jgi:hypothetical protein